MSEMRLYDAEGNRLYLTRQEREDFLKCAQQNGRRPEVQTFAETLAYTGCRISEALELVPNRIQASENKIVLRSLKKRRSDVYREVPVPEDVIKTLDLVHQVVKHQNSKRLSNLVPLWKWTRQHSYEIIKNLMIDAGIPEGKHRTPKGLRHAFGVNAIAKGVPITLLQKWLGHSDLNTTGIYANAIGKEESDLAMKMWI